MRAAGVAVGGAGYLHRLEQRGDLGELTTALTGSGAPIDGPAGVAGQVAVVIAAARAGQPALAVVAAVALVFVAVATAWFRTRRPAAA